MKTLFLCGAGNSEGVRLALGLNRQFARWAGIVLLDDDPEKHGRKVLGVEIAGGFDALAGAEPSQSETANLIARTAGRRKAAQERIDQFGIPPANLISPGVEIEGSEIGKNVVAYQNSVIGPETVIGDNSVVFMGAIVGHESRLGSGCILAPHAVLNARVVLGDHVYVGTHGTILPEIEVGARAIIGAGSVVMENVPAGATVMGVPAQLLGTCPTGHGQESQRNERESNMSEVASESWFEATIADIWKDALGIARVRSDDDFFRLGGNSLSALRITFHLRQLFQIDIPLQTIFDTPTVSGLAGRLEPLVLARADEAMLSRLVNELQLHPNSSGG